MNKKDMLQQMIDHYENGNKTRFAKRIGISPQGVSTWLNRGTIDYELVYAKCENINADWLLSGKGGMIRNNENSTMEDTPVATHISSAEETIIYKMYKDEKEEKERLIKEKDAKIDQLQSELRQQSAELAALKVLRNKEKDYQFGGIVDTFVAEPSSDYGGGFSNTNPPPASKKSSAGKMHK